MDDKTLVEQLRDILPLLKDLETGQDCAEYAFAKGDGFQAMTYCPDAFEALRVLPEAIETIEAQATRIEALEAALRNPPRHKWWGAGEPDCPPELKAPNGELWRMQCKVCGNGTGDGVICQGGLQQALAGDTNHG